MSDVAPSDGMSGGRRRGASVKSLKRSLKKAGLKVSGKKATLRARAKKAHLKVKGGAGPEEGEMEGARRRRSRRSRKFLGVF
jgi:hypothetical protein